MLNRRLFRFMDRVVTYRYGILVLMGILSVLSLWLFPPYINNHSELYWLKNSPLSHASDEQTEHIYRLDCEGDLSSDRGVDALLRVQQTLSAAPSIAKIHSIFTVPVGIMRHGESPESKMFTFSTLDDPQLHGKPALIGSHREDFAPYVDPDNHTVSFYLFSDDPELSIPPLPLQYRLSKPFDPQTPDINKIVLGALVVLGALFFRWVFRTWVASAVIVSYMLLLGLFSLAVYDRLMLYHHISLFVIAVILGLMNILYFYYLWHIHQRRIGSRKSLKYAWSRAVVPQLFSSALIMAAMGSLIALTDSAVMFSLGVFTLISLAVSLVLMVFFAPALLSFFSLASPSIVGAGVYEKFSSRFCAARPRWILAIVLGAMMALAMGWSLFMKQHSPSVSPPMLLVGVQADPERPLQQLLEAERSLKTFEDIESVESFVSFARYVYPKNREDQELIQDQAIGGVLFYMDLFGLRGHFFDGETALMRIYLKPGVDITPIVSRLEGLEVPVGFYDTSSRITELQSGAFLLLGALGGTVMLIIGGLVLLYSKNLASAVSVLCMNALPVVLTMGLAWVLHLPMGIELLVALLLGIAITSDAEIHHFYNLFADGKRLDDDVIQNRLERFHLSAMNVFVHTIVLAVLGATALMLQGSVALVCLYLGLVVLLGTLIDLYMIPRVLDSKHCTGNKNET